MENSTFSKSLGNKSGQEFASSIARGALREISVFFSGLPLIT